MANRLNGILNNQDYLLRQGRGRGYKSVASFLEINAIYASAAGLCEIFGKPRGKRNHALDHNHATGKLRGILCVNCNQGIGHFKDDTSLMDKAIAYLKKYEAA